MALNGKVKAIAFQGLSTSWDQARTEENTENLLKYISKLSLLHFKTNTFPFQAALEITLMWNVIFLQVVQLLHFPLYPCRSNG